MSGIEQSGAVACKNGPAEMEVPAAHVIAIALSAGGLSPLLRMMTDLPDDLPAAVVIVQHINAISHLPQILNSRGTLRAKFAEAAELLRPQTVYVGPPGRHLVIGPEGRFELADAPRVRHSRPSADWMFESVAASFGDRTVAVVLSGRLGDGSRGAMRVKQAGGRVIVQEPASCMFADMPLAAIRTGAVDDVLPPEQLAAGSVRALFARNLDLDARQWRDPFNAA
jgi:two-component system chemotaxis response regulator CheB